MAGALLLPLGVVFSTWQARRPPLSDDPATVPSPGLGWSLAHDGQYLVWRAPLWQPDGPGRRSWRARVFAGSSLEPRHRLLADSGQQCTRVYPNHLTVLSRFPTPIGMTSLRLEFEGEGVPVQRSVVYTPPSGAPDVKEAHERARAEWETARRYGVRWPESEVWLAMVEAVAVADRSTHEVRVLAAGAATWLQEELRRRRENPALWRSVPPRSMNALAVKDGRLVRDDPFGFAPANEVFAALAPPLAEDPLATLLAEVILLPQATPEDTREYHAWNQAVLPKRDPPRGVWLPPVEPPTTGDPLARSAALLRVTRFLADFRRLAPLLAGHDPHTADPPQALRISTETTDGTIDLPVVWAQRWARGDDARLLLAVDPPPAPHAPDPADLRIDWTPTPSGPFHPTPLQSLLVEHEGRRLTPLNPQRPLVLPALLLIPEP